MITGIIPAAGMGTRWGNFTKELLPFGDNYWLIDYCIDAMLLGEVDRICIISSPEKINTHVQHFLKDKYKDIDIFYVIQKKGLDMWAAVEVALPFTTEVNYFGMPDTIFNKNCFKIMKQNTDLEFIMGTFLTTRPENFGVWWDNKIVNKISLSLTNPETIYTAWGNFLFTDNIVNLWNIKNIKTYTEAINIAIEEYGFNQASLEYYYDFQNWDEYKKYIQENGYEK